MKKLLTILSTIILLSGCDNNQVTISKEEYQKLKGDTIKPEYPITIKPISWTTDITLITIKNHEYLFAETRGTYGGIALTHFPDCKFCKKDTL